MTDYERFQIKVATALARWQVVEINMQEIFLDVIESKDRRWAAVAYHTIIAFKGKLDMLHEIISYRLETEKAIKEWKQLLKKLVAANSERNKLVHWTFIATYTEEDRENYVFLAVPPFGDARKKYVGKKITEADLDEMISTFSILQHEVNNFRQRLQTSLASQEKH